MLEVPATDYAAANNFGGVSLDGVSSATVKAGVPGEKVPVVTIDSFGLAKLRLLKIDVEGMERAVLAGARQTITRCRPYLYFEADRKERNPSLIALAFELGYPPLVVRAALVQPEEFRGQPRQRVRPDRLAEFSGRAARVRNPGEGLARGPERRRADADRLRRHVAGPGTALVLWGAGVVRFPSRSSLPPTLLD